MVLTGETVASYEHFGPCTQAAATRNKGELACKPVTATAATDTPDPSAPTTASPEAALPEPQPPVIEQPATVVPPLMQSSVQIAAALLPLGAVGFAVDRVVPTLEAPVPQASGSFRTTCDYSHMAYDDPIVYPGLPGASHLHTFFGNKGTSAASTAESIRTTGNSTCRGGTINRTAYWVPSMIDTVTKKPIPPDVGNFYYKQAYQLDPASPMQSLPAGLRMIAGNPSNTTAIGASGYRFRCQGGPNDSNDQYGPTIPSCDAAAQVVQEIFFPPCWDGKNLDAPDHKSHMSYPVPSLQAPGTWACPSSHPVIVPQVTFNVAYTVPTDGATKTWRLASDTYDSAQPGGYSSHGDWFNGWKQDVLDAWHSKCVAAHRDCHSHLLGDGRAMY